MSENVKLRRELEKRIVTAVIDAALAAGYWLNIHNGGDGPELAKPTQDKALLLKEMFATDDESLLVYNDLGYVGFVYFIYGNGRDVISDHTDNEIIRGIVKPGMDIADKY